MIFEASWQPQERVQKPPDETEPRQTLLYEKKKVVASSGSHDLFTLICTMVPKKTPSHNATLPGGAFTTLSQATVDFLSAQQTLNLLRV